MPEPNNSDVIVIGAGLSGLIASLTLQEQHRTVKLLEASDRPGGRIKTDLVDGYLLDRGFQVLLTEYPEAKRYLDYDALQLRSFTPGALILNEDGKHEITDPSRVPAAAFKTLFSNIASINDKLRVLKLKGRLKPKTVEEIFNQTEKSTLAVIQEYGFSERMLRNFFQPFMAGIFLEEALTTSRREFDFVFKMFSEGDTAVPARGMEEIPKQLAQQLKPDTLLTGQQVQSIEGQTVTTADGSTFTAPQILVATEPNNLLKSLSNQTSTEQHHSTVNVYFTAEVSPIPKPILALNAKANRLVNNIVVMNEVSPAYAPEDKYLISAAITGQRTESDEELAGKIKNELAPWFGKQLEGWQHLKTYRIDYALPNQDSVTHDLTKERCQVQEGLFITGDYLLNGSINAAMRAGRQAAEILMQS